jgi:hypothetical protein
MAGVLDGGIAQIPAAFSADGSEGLAKQNPRLRIKTSGLKFRLLCGATVRGTLE